MKGSQTQVVLWVALVLVGCEAKIGVDVLTGQATSAPPAPDPAAGPATVSEPALPAAETPSPVPAPSPAATPVDTDGDGVFDPQDECPGEDDALVTERYKDGDADGLTVASPTPVCPSDPIYNLLTETRGDDDDTAVEDDVMNVYVCENVDGDAATSDGACASAGHERVFLISHPLQWLSFAKHTHSKEYCFDTQDVALSFSGTMTGALCQAISANGGYCRDSMSQYDPTKTTSGSCSFPNTWQAATNTPLAFRYPDAGDDAMVKAHVRLRRDVDFALIDNATNDADGTANGTFTTDKRYHMAGAWESGFSGTLDGAGFTIKNLKMTDPTTDQRPPALFGLIRGTCSAPEKSTKADCDFAAGTWTFAEVKDLVLDLEIVTAAQFTGALASMIFDARIIRVNTRSNITSTEREMGGLIGDIQGEASLISGCSNTGTMTNTRSGSLNVGGIAARANFGRIEKTWNTATIYAPFGVTVGGIAGEYSNTMSDVYNAGTITGGYRVGGIAGAMFGGPGTVMLTRALNVGKVVSTTIAAPEYGAIVGYISNGAAAMLTDGHYLTATVCKDANSSDSLACGANVSDTTTDYLGFVVGSGYITTAGKSASAMKTEATFPNFDFANVWQILNVASHPTLR